MGTGVPEVEHRDSKSGEECEVADCVCEGADEVFGFFALDGDR